MRTLEYLKLLIPFLGALLGAVIGTPLIEVFKDRLLANRLWKNQRNEIISTVRLVNGMLIGFNELRFGAFGGPKQGYKVSLEYAAALKAYSLDILKEQLPKLASLHPKSADTQAAGQYLIKHLLRLQAHCENIKSIQPVNVRSEDGEDTVELSQSDLKTLASYDSQFIALGRFLYHVYAKEMHINQGSLVGVDRVRLLENQFLLADMVAAKDDMNDVGKAIDSLLRTLK